MYITITLCSLLGVVICRRHATQKVATSGAPRSQPRPSSKGAPPVRSAQTLTLCNAVRQTPTHAQAALVVSAP